MTAVKKAAKKAAKATPVHFVILVSLETDSDGDQYTVPRNIPGLMHPGDTVSYESPDGQVTVKFDKDQGGTDHTSPYVDATGDLQTVQSGVVLNVVNKGTYFGKCFITRTLQTGVREKIGWRREDSSKPDSSKQVSSTQDRLESGGNHVVKGPGG
jgi:hypothetical protein